MKKALTLIVASALILASTAFAQDKMRDTKMAHKIAHHKMMKKAHMKAKMSKMGAMKHHMAPMKAHKSAMKHKMMKHKMMKKAMMKRGG